MVMMKRRSDSFRRWWGCIYLFIVLIHNVIKNLIFLIFFVVKITFFLSSTHTARAHVSRVFGGVMTSVSSFLLKLREHKNPTPRGKAK